MYSKSVSQSVLEWVSKGSGRGEWGEKRGGTSEREGRKREKVGDVRKGKVNYDYSWEGLKIAQKSMIIAERGWISSKLPMIIDERGEHLQKNWSLYDGFLTVPEVKYRFLRGWFSENSILRGGSFTLSEARDPPTDAIKPSELSTLTKYVWELNFWYLGSQEHPGSAFFAWTWQCWTFGTFQTSETMFAAN